MGTDEALESELGLGELAGLTVANEAENLSYDVSVELSSRTKTKTSAQTTALEAFVLLVKLSGESVCLDY